MSSDLSKLNSKYAKDVFAAIGDVVLAGQGKTKNSKSALNTICKKLTKKEPLADYENEYLLHCLKKIQTEAKKPYKNDPFNLREGKESSVYKEKNTKKYKQEVCYHEVRRLMSLHQNVRDAIAGNLEGFNSFLKWKYVDSGNKLEGLELDYTCELTVGGASEVIGKNLKKIMILIWLKRQLKIIIIIIRLYCKKKKKSKSINDIF